MREKLVRAMLLFAVGGLLFVLGLCAGSLLAPARELEASPLSQPAADVEVRELRTQLEKLTSEFAALRAELRFSREAPMGRIEEGAHANSVSAAESTPTRVAIASAAGEELEAVLARLDALESTLRSLLEARPASASALDLRIPQGVPSRDFLQTLKESDIEDEVKRAHLLWTTQHVHDTYGAPDEVTDFGDHIEWIYKLPAEGTQFDFHFVRGLVVEAH